MFWTNFYADLRRTYRHYCRLRSERTRNRNLLMTAVDSLFPEFRKAFKVILGQALTTVAEDLLPRLWKARDAGDNIEYEGWRWSLSIVENTLGSEKFKRFLRQYLNEREGKPALLPVPVIRTQGGS